MSKYTCIINIPGCGTHTVMADTPRQAVEAAAECWRMIGHIADGGGGRIAVFMDSLLVSIWHVYHVIRENGHEWSTQEES